MKDLFMYLWLIPVAFTIAPADADEVLIVEPPVIETGTGIEIQTITDSSGAPVGEMTTYGTDPSNTYTEIQLTTEE